MSSWAKARAFYQEDIPEKVSAALVKELDLIRQLGYAQYFLTVHDIVAHARSKGILCQGRGSAANSAVCYCLGVTSVDPERMDVLFERFMSRERNEAPDIDVDFEHERREEVLQYVYEKYGRERADWPPKSSPTGLVPPSATSARRSASPKTAPPRWPRSSGAAGATTPRRR